MRRREAGDRRGERPRRHARQPGHDRAARSGRPQDREDRERHLADRRADQHAGGQRLGRGGARRRSGTRLRGRVERHPQPRARGRGERRQASRTRSAASSTRSPRCGATSSRSSAAVEVEVQTNRAVHGRLRQGDARKPPRWASANREILQGAEPDPVGHGRNGRRRAADRDRRRGGERGLAPGGARPRPSRRAAPRISPRRSRRSPRSPTS